jgi:hypothetical protein
MSGVVYDAGALIAAERNDRALGADHRVRLEQGIIPIIPAAVIAEASWLSRQAQLRRLLRGCDVADLDENIAHRGWDPRPRLHLRCRRWGGGRRSRRPLRCGGDERPS